MQEWSMMSTVHTAVVYSNLAMTIEQDNHY